MQAQASRGIIGTDSNHGLRLKTNATDRITIQTDGDVGIGTTTPAEKLDVNGSIQANNNFKFKGSGGYYLYNSSGTFRGGIIDDGGATKIYGDGNGSTPIITLDGGNIKTGGNLIFDDDANNSDYLIDFQEHPDGTYGAYIRYDGSASNALEIGTRNAGTETESIFIDRNTADVTFRQDVDVQGDFKIESVFPRIYLVDTNHNNDYSILNGNGYFGVYDDTAGLYRFKINSSGNAVIGDGNPSNLGFLEKSLEIQAGSSSDTTLKQAGLVISGSSDSDDSDDFAYLSFRNNHSTLSNDRVAELRIVKNGTNVDTADMKFYTANGTSLAARMTLTNDGKLGIGTELPSSTLEVVGDIRANRMYDRTNTSYYVDPASTSILYNIDVQNTTTTRGSVVVDTDTNQNLFYISRTGSTSQEYTSFGRDDTTTHIHTKNDESSSTIRFRIENTDTESGGGANANDRNIDLISDANNARILIDGNKVATESYVDTEISSLVASAPDALNTLNELAAALGDDENFSTTVTNNLAGKLNLTGGTLTGTLTSRSINMQNYTLSNVGQMSFNDPGPNEGISWSGGNFKIYESPNDLSTNSAGNLQFVSGGSRRLTVQTDGTVYVPGTLKAEKVEIEGALFDVETNSLRMPLVKGGHYNSDTSSVTGAISIVLPSGTYANATMMNFFVDVFDYAGGSDGESFTLHIGGYNYTDGTWHNVFANLISGRTDRFFTVRFNYDSTNNANIIYIAETTSNWAYPKVTVRDFSAGFSGADDADWYNNSFTVSITSTMFGTTSRSKTAENVASYALNADKLDGSHLSELVKKAGGNTISGNTEFYGTDTSGSYANAPIEIREVNLVTTNQSSEAYAPELAFHWGGRSQTSIWLSAQGKLNLAGNQTGQILTSDDENIFNTYRRDTIDSSSEDFDDYTTSGTYAVNNWSESGDVVQNGPTNTAAGNAYGWGMLRVTNFQSSTGTGDGYVVQEYIPHVSDTHYVRFQWNGSWTSWRAAWGSDNDGAGSGLDADKVDGLQASQFLRSDTADTAAGDITFSGNIVADLRIKLNSPSNNIAPLNIKSDAEAQAIHIEETGAGTESWQIGVNGDGDLNFYNSGASTPTIQFYDSNSVFFPENVTMKNLQMTSNGSRTKIRVWSGSTYGMGMTSGFTYGGLGASGGEYAMTFQMNDDTDRGFWWGHSVHTTAQGAMALTTDGELTVANAIRVGYGEADTTTPADNVFDINGNVTIAKTTTGGQNQIKFQEAGTTKTQITSNYGDDKFYLYHEGDNVMTIDSSSVTTFSSTVNASYGRLSSVEYNGSDVNKVNFALSGSTLTITTS